MQPEPVALVEHAGIHINSEPFMQIKSDSKPVAYDVAPFDLNIRLFRLGRRSGRVVPVTHATRRVIRPATCVIRPISPRRWVVRAVGASYQAVFLRLRVWRGFGAGFGAGFGSGFTGSGSVSIASSVAASPFPADSQCSSATFSPMP